MRAHLTLSTNTTNPTPTYTLLLNNIFYTIPWLSNPILNIPITPYNLENFNILVEIWDFFLFWIYKKISWNFKR